MENNEILQAILSEMRDMRQDIQRIDQRTTKIEVHMENNTEKKLQLLLEGQQGMNEKFRQLDELTEKVEDIQTTVEILKHLSVKK